MLCNFLPEFSLAEEHKNKVHKKPASVCCIMSFKKLCPFVRLTELASSKCTNLWKLKCSQKYVIEIH